MFNFRLRDKRETACHNGVAMLEAPVYEHYLHRMEQRSHKLGKGREKYLSRQRESEQPCE